MEATAKAIAEIMVRLGKLEEAVFSRSNKSASDRPKSKSPKEFLISKSATSDPQRLLVLGYFLEHFENMQSFNIRDLENVFHKAKVSLPININGTVNKCIERGFLMDAPEKKDGKKAWHLTGTGEIQVEIELNKQGELT
jgi:hypothetical protein